MVQKINYVGSTVYVQFFSALRLKGFWLKWVSRICAIESDFYCLNSDDNFPLLLVGFHIAMGSHDFI